MLAPNHPYRNRPLDDLAWMLRSSDKAAFEEIFSRLVGRLGRYADRLAGADAAADVVQDVFLKLWEQRSTLEIRTSLQAMLYTMVRNRCLNALRDSSRRKHEPVSDETRPARDPSPEERAVGADLGERVAAWIDELPPRRAEAFILSRYDELPHKVIAELMGISKRTVDTHILHALRHLRDRLEACERQTTPS